MGGCSKGLSKEGAFGNTLPQNGAGSLHYDH